MGKKKIFVYVGTWPILLRGAGSIPGFQSPGNMDASVETGIFGFLMDPETGDWTPSSNFYTSSLTSELCLSPDGKHLFANDEERNRKGVLCAGGSILSFAIDHESGELALVDEQPSMGTSPTSVETDASGRYAFMANLGNPHEKFARVVKTEDGGFEMTTAEEEGSVAMFCIKEDGSLTRAIDVVGFECGCPGTHKDGFAHHHCVKVDPSNRFLLVCDMNDKIHVFRIDHEKGRLIPAERPFFQTRAGVEPRTIKFHPDKPWFFVNNQRNSTVYSFSFDSADGSIEELDYESAVFNEEDSRKSWTSEMAISPDGKHLYVSNRSLQKRMPDVICPPNTVAIFGVDQETGRLVLKEVIPSEADNPRGIALSPNGEYLYVTSMDTNEVYRYNVDADNGMLSNPDVVAKVPVPSSIEFLVAK